MSFAGISRFDLVGENAELVSLGFAQVGAIGLFKEKEEVEDVIFGQVEINDSRTAALSPPRKRHPGLAQAAAADKQVTSFRIIQQFLLERAILLVGYPFCNLPGEMRGFNERDGYRLV